MSASTCMYLNTQPYAADVILSRTTIIVYMHEQIYSGY
jgi:hypothetical protein